MTEPIHTWTSTKEYGNNNQSCQVTLTRDDGKVIRSTWWGVCDGSAECEADEFRRDFEAKERKERESAEMLLPWDPNKCSCHISPPCGYCESGEYQEP